MRMTGTTSWKQFIKKEKLSTMNTKLFLVLLALFVFASPMMAQGGSETNWVAIASGFSMAFASGLCGLGQAKAVAACAEGMARNPAAAAAIRRQGVGGVRELQMEVWRASFEPVAGGGGQVAAWEAELAVRFTLSGPVPRTVELHRTTTVAAPSEGAVGIATTRAQVFEALAVLLAEEAVAWFLYSPVAR